MGADSPKKPPRSRITIDIDPQMLEAINAEVVRRGGTHRAFYIDAIEQSLHPAPVFRFYAPRPPAREPLELFLNDAREIVICGIVLSSLWDDSLLAFLQRKIAEDRGSMTFLTVDPEIDEQDPVYRVLHRRYRRAFHDDIGLKEALRRTSEVLRSLHEEGAKHGVDVRVMGIRDVPMCGMVISDPFASSCKMRVALYLHVHPNEFHPFLEINAHGDEGREASYSFLRHYERLIQSARLIGSLAHPWRLED